MLSRKGLKKIPYFQINQVCSLVPIKNPQKASSLQIWLTDVSRNGLLNKKSLILKGKNIIRTEETTTHKWCGRLPKNVSTELPRFDDAKNMNRTTTENRLRYDLDTSIYHYNADLFRCIPVKAFGITSRYQNYKNLFKMKTVKADLV